MADNLDQAAKNRQAIADIKRKYLSGEISRDEAKRLAQPVLDRVNTRAIQIAAKHGKKDYPKFSFTEAMRNNY